MLPPFRLARPETLDEALDALGEDQVAYCGGTELLLAMGAGLTRPDVLVDVKRLPELAGIRLDGDHLVIGATERHADVATHPLVRRHAPMLSAVERAVGNARVRSQGSVGGNLCFAEPKSDVAPRSSRSRPWRRWCRPTGGGRCRWRSSSPARTTPPRSPASCWST